MTYCNNRLLSIYYSQNNMSLQYILRLINSHTQHKMKIKNSIIDTSLHISKSEFCPQTNLSTLYFKRLTISIKQHPYYKLMVDENMKFQQKGKIDSQSTIKPKMFMKVVKWMQKLCLTTLEFSIDTFEISVKILKLYLQNTQESPKSLQMLGCIALHIASKMNEQTIISIQSYIECCMNIFNKQEFLKKQSLFYSKISANMEFPTIANLLKFIQFQIQNQNVLAKQKSDKLYQTLRIIAVDVQLVDYDQINIACNLWTQVFCNNDSGGFEYNKQQFVKLLETRKFQY